MSKNEISIQQIQLSCKHVNELVKAGMTENFAIRNLEQFANFYGKFRAYGTMSPDRADQFKLWSKAALSARKANPEKPFGSIVRNEHGTPRRQFARLILKAYKSGCLTKEWLDELCDKKWKVAVITIEEDLRLNKIARSEMYKTPEARWAAAEIQFLSTELDILEVIPTQHE